eukprot:m.33459 g.33459  ORF g.33459 m.33459 type:complete len:290 (+) comp8543_c0_seq3:118-987(+)
MCPITLCMSKLQLPIKTARANNLKFAACVFFISVGIAPVFARQFHMDLAIVTNSPIVVDDQSIQTMSGWEALFSWAATLITLAMFGSGLPVISEISRHKSAAGIPFVPWLAQIVNCLLWMRYGDLTENGTILSVNIIGFVLDLFYLTIVWMYTSDKATLIKPYLLTGTISLVCLGYIQYLRENESVAVFYAGIMACVGSIIMFASPLVTVMEVIRLRSTEPMMFSQSLLFFLCSASWAGFGLAVGDMFVQVPNFIGAVFAALQLFLFAVFPAPSSKHGLQSTGIVRGDL